MLRVILIALMFAFCARTAFAEPSEGRDGKTEDTALPLEGDELRLAGERFDDDYLGTGNEPAKVFLSIRLARGEGFDLHLVQGWLNAVLWTKEMDHPILYAADWWFEYAGMGRKHMVYRAVAEREEVTLKIQSNREFAPYGWERRDKPPYEIVLKRLPNDAATQDRAQRVQAFVADDGPARRELVLEGKGFAEDFASAKHSACNEMKDSPNAQFEMWLDAGELLSVRVDCEGSYCPVPAIEPIACKSAQSCSENPKTCGIFEGLGYIERDNPRGRSYRAKKRVKVRVEIAVPLRTRQHEESQLLDGNVTTKHLYTDHVNPEYRITMVRKRAKATANPLGNRPDKPIVAQFDSQGKAVIEGDNFAEEFATPKKLSVKLDKEIPWIPSAWIAVDLKKGEKLSAQSNLGHYALVRMEKKNAVWIADDWSAWRKEHEEGFPVNPDPLEYVASKEERVYFVVSPQAGCVWGGCRNDENDPYRTLKGEKLYNKAELEDEASCFSEGESAIFRYENSRCDKKSCGLENEGPYRIELRKTGP